MVTRAHATTLHDLLDRFNTVVVVVLRTENTFTAPADLAREHAEFYRLCDENCLPAKNPFTADERAGFWRTYLSASDLGDRVDVQVSDRMELNPQLFNERFPRDTHELVFVRPGNDAGRFDQVRRACLSTILDREISEMTPTFEEHTSQLRDRLLAREPGWEQLLAPGVAAEFERINGFDRYLGRSADRSPWEDVVARDIAQVRQSTNAPHSTIERYRAHLNRLYERTVTGSQLTTAPGPSGPEPSEVVRAEVSHLSRSLADAARVDDITPAEQTLLGLYRLLFDQALPEGCDA